MLAALVKSITLPVMSTRSSDNSSVLSSYPLTLIATLFKALPIFSLSCKTSWPAVNNAIVSDRVEFIAAIAAEERDKPDMISLLSVAKRLPISLIGDIIPSLTSSTSILNAFITLTSPVVAVSTSMPGEMLANIDESLDISVAASFVEKPNLDQLDAWEITSLVVTPNCLATSLAE